MPRWMLQWFRICEANRFFFIIFCWKFKQSAIINHVKVWVKFENVYLFSRNCDAESAYRGLSLSITWHTVTGNMMWIRPLSWSFNGCWYWFTMSPSIDLKIFRFSQINYFVKKNSKMISFALVLNNGRYCLRNFSKQRCLHHGIDDMNFVWITDPEYQTKFRISLANHGLATEFQVIRLARWPCQFGVNDSNQCSINGDADHNLSHKQKYCLWTFFVWVSITKPNGCLSSSQSCSFY